MNMWDHVTKCCLGCKHRARSGEGKRDAQDEEHALCLVPHHLLASRGQKRVRDDVEP